MNKLSIVSGCHLKDEVPRFKFKETEEEEE